MQQQADHDGHLTLTSVCFTPGMSATKTKELGSSFTSTAVLAVGSCANSHILLLLLYAADHITLHNITNFLHFVLFQDFANPKP